MGAGVYVDTGVLLKLYAPEVNSAQADALILGFPGPLPLTHIQELEIRNALRLKRGRGELTDREVELALGDFHADIEAGRYERPIYDLKSVFLKLRSCLGSMPPRRNAGAWICFMSLRL